MIQLLNWAGALILPVFVKKCKLLPNWRCLSPGSFLLSVWFVLVACLLSHQPWLWRWRVPPRCSLVTDYTVLYCGNLRCCWIVCKYVLAPSAYCLQNIFSPSWAAVTLQSGSWLQSMLRGRGGCYKHSFYGIESHRCMETTPSLACANKCVFCWRHHTNPVGTEWRWKMDPPEQIMKEALENHYNMIRQFRGELSDCCIDVTVITVWCRALEKSVITQLVKSAQQFVEFEGSLPYSQETTIGPVWEPG